MKVRQRSNGGDGGQTVVTDSSGLKSFVPSGECEPWANSSWMVIQLSRMRRLRLLANFLCDSKLPLGES